MQIKILCYKNKSYNIERLKTNNEIRTPGNLNQKQYDVIMIFDIIDFYQQNIVNLS